MYRDTLHLCSLQIAACNAKLYIYGEKRGVSGHGVVAASFCRAIIALRSVELTAGIMFGYIWPGKYITEQRVVDDATKGAIKTLTHKKTNITKTKMSIGTSALVVAWCQGSSSNDRPRVRQNEEEEEEEYHCHQAPYAFMGAQPNARDLSIAGFVVVRACYDYLGNVFVQLARFMDEMGGRIVRCRMNRFRCFIWAKSFLWCIHICIHG